MHPLFSDAPMAQQAQTMPAQPVGSQLAAALSGQVHPLSLQAPSMGGALPLASMMKAMQDPGTGSQVTSATPNLAWNPNNPVGTETLGGNTANQGSMAGNAAAAYLPGYQGGAPQQPQQAMPPGMPSMGGPGMAAQGQTAPGMPPQLGMMGTAYGGGFGG